MIASKLGHIVGALCLAAAFQLQGLPGSYSALAAGPEAIGKVLDVKGSASIEHSKAVAVQANLNASGSDQAKVGDLVYEGDVLQTGADGALGVVFGDGTSFNISSNARMEMNEFVYNPKGKSNSTLINLQKGTFTFLAGNIAKTGNMRVETPVGTMGIRGTAPHVEILQDGTVKFTTLVEENKKNDQGKPTAPTSNRRTENVPMPDATAQRAERELQRKLNICRGC